MNKEEKLKVALNALGPVPPDCCGCAAEWKIAVDAITEILAQPAQEPVAWMMACAMDDFKRGYVVEVSRNQDESDDIGLYTTPPQRPWVGLTHVEAAECWETSATKTWHNFETKLKEKNV